MFLSLSVSAVRPLSARSAEMCVLFPYPSVPPFFSSNEAFSSIYRSASSCRLLFLLAMKNIASAMSIVMAPVVARQPPFI